jgi:hypothetical protein
MTATVLAAVEEGGLSFILFAVMVIAIFIVHKLTIPR